MNPNEPAPQSPATEPQAAPQAAPTFTPGIANGVQTPQPAPAEPTQQQPQVTTQVQDTPQPNAAPQPAPQPTSQEVSTATPQEPSSQPTQNVPEPAQPTQNTQQMTYDEYLESLTKDIPTVEMPKPTDVDQKDPDGLVKFFDDYSEKLLEKARQDNLKQSIVQNAEREAWGQVFTKYPEIQNNNDLRDTIHNIRMGAYSRGQSLSPIQVADALVGTLHTEYKKGVNDTNVQTKVVDSQPLGGGSQAPVAPEVNYEALQTGGEQAAVAQLEALMAAGKL